MNNDLQQFSEERLKELASTPEKYDHRYTCNMLNGDESRALARIALAAKQAKPVTMDSLRDAVAEMSGGLPMEWKEGNDKGHHAVPFINFNSLHRIVTKFTTPQPDHTEQDGWIKCSERMPEIEEDYYQTFSSAGVDISYFFEGYFADQNITHWMPLPAAPKPESE